MKKSKKRNHTKVAIFAGATALMALTPSSYAQSAGDALVDKLEQKGILSADEAKQLREENKQDFAGSFMNNFDQAFDKATGTPDWISPNLNAPAGEPNNSAIHVMADLMWKF
jgi:hypothetical protein